MGCTNSRQSKQKWNEGNCFIDVPIADQYLGEESILEIIAKQFTLIKGED